MSTVLPRDGRSFFSFFSTFPTVSLMEASVPFFSFLRSDFGPNFFFFPPPVDRIQSSFFPATGTLFLPFSSFFSSLFFERIRENRPLFFFPSFPIESDFCERDPKHHLIAFFFFLLNKVNFIPTFFLLFLFPSRVFFFFFWGKIRP